MKIYCEIPDHICRIFEEFLQISDQVDGDMIGYIILFLKESALHKLRTRYRELEQEIDKSQDDGKKEDQKEVGDKIFELICFGSDWTRIWVEKYAKAKGKEAEKQKRKEISGAKRRWQDAFENGRGCAATRRKA